MNLCCCVPQLYYLKVILAYRENNNFCEQWNNYVHVLPYFVAEVKLCTQLNNYLWIALKITELAKHGVCVRVCVFVRARVCELKIHTHHCIFEDVHTYKM